MNSITRTIYTMTENVRNEMKSANKTSVIKSKLETKIIDIICVIFIRMHLYSDPTRM